MIFYPIINRIVNELNRRFKINSPILNGISSLNPKNSTFLNVVNILPFARHYGVDTDSLEVELKLLPKLIKRQKEENNYEIKTILDFAKLLDNYKMAFSETFILCKIAIIIPPSSAGVERTFSSLRQIKTYLTNHMCNEKLTSVAILKIEKRISKGLNLDKL